jgi:predicted SAM-dependent methyltransferase
MLNIGCGGIFHPDWTNIDLKPSTPDVMQVDILRGLPFADATFEVVYHSHLLEHLSPVEGKALLKECWRVLKSPGRIRVVVPDLEAAARLYLHSLEEVLTMEKPSVQHEHYEWSVLFLIDQMVRTQAGGQMAEFLRREVLSDESFVIEQGGGYVARSFRQPEALDKLSLPAHMFQWLKKGNLLKRLRRLMVRLLMPDLYRQMLFQQSGEIHRWMYDRYSLPLLLQEVGFLNPQPLPADTSQIAGWESYHLDIDPHGRVHKPLSLYVEADK